MATDMTQVVDEAFSLHACSTMIGLGGAALGGFAIGAVPLGALSLAAAGVAAKKCLDNPIPALPGAGIPYLGGNCPVEYEVSVRLKWIGTSTGAQYAASASRGTRGLGPFLGIEQVFPSSNTTLARLKFSDRVVDFGGQTQPPEERLKMQDITWESIGRADGLPDNCGNTPFLPYPPPSSPYPPVIRDPDGRPILPGNTYNISFRPSVNFPPVFIPVTFAPVVLVPPLSFPLSFRVDLGGIQIGKVQLLITGDTVIDLSGGELDQQEQADYKKILKQIKDCACANSPEPPELEVLSVPVVLPDEPDCDLSFVDLLVLKGTVDPNDAVKLARSAELARQGCEIGTPQQEPESEIFSGVSTLLNHEFFSPEIPREVYSVRLQIDSFGPAPIPVTSFPGSSQYKFGSISWCGPLSDGSGEPTLVFDTRTYMVLPRAHLKGHVRILLKEGCSFRLFDTGERVSSIK